MTTGAILVLSTWALALRLAVALLNPLGATQTIDVVLRITHTIFESTMFQTVHEPVNMTELSGGETTAGSPVFPYTLMGAPLP
jgi:hypothetical protein